MPQLEHARFAPSSIARVIACPGSVTLCEKVEPHDLDDKDAREGVAAHWVLSEMLSDTSAIGDVAPNGIVLNDEMIDGAEMCANYIKQRDGYLVMAASIERTLPAGDLHPDNWGTPDYSLRDYENRRLYVDDFKYGHKYVEVFQNWQLINYAILELQDMGLNGHETGEWQVTMTIHQPRNYHPDGHHRAWTVKADDLRTYANILRNAMSKASKDDATLNAKDPSQCEYCPARHFCPAAASAGYRAIETAYTSNPLILSAQEVAIELKRVRQAQLALKGRETGLSAQVMALLKRGENVPYFSIDHPQGRTVWKEGQEESIAHLAAALGVQGVSKSSVVTPKQAAKLGLPADVIEEYSTTPRGAAELVEDNGMRAMKVFLK